MHITMDEIMVIINKMIEYIQTIGALISIISFLFIFISIITDLKGLRYLNKEEAECRRKQK
jgi:hypothetical protein